MRAHFYDKMVTRVTLDDSNPFDPVKTSEEVEEVWCHMERPGSQDRAVESWDYPKDHPNVKRCMGAPFMQMAWRLYCGEPEAKAEKPKAKAKSKAKAKGRKKNA